jgi:GNAT superfamily N-acetyltransferase
VQQRAPTEKFGNSRTLAEAGSRSNVARAVARARPATEADVPAVLHLFDELFAASTRTGGRGPDEVPSTAGRRAEAEQRYRASLADLDSRLLVAVVDDVTPVPSSVGTADLSRDKLEPIHAEPVDGGTADPVERDASVRGTAAQERVVGMVLCSVGGSGTFLDAPVVQMNHFFVLPSARRRGAGRALIAAATAWAEQRGLDGLGVAVYPDSREANRYFARLGFSPVYVHRVAPLAGLKRMLGSAVPAAAREESAHGVRRRLRVGITGTRATSRTRRYPA